MEIDNEIAAVVKAPMAYFDYRKIAIASLYLQNPQVLFVVSNEDPVFCSGKSGRMQPDVGATLEAIEVASSRKATRIGKPELFCFQTILEDYFLEDKEKWTDKAFLD